MIYAGLRDAILGVMGDRKDWELGKLIAAVERTPVVTPNDREEWGGQTNLSHRVRSELAKLKKGGIVKRPRHATYRLV